MHANTGARLAATSALALAFVILVAAVFAAANAHAYEGPMWALGEEDVAESTNVKSPSSVNTFEDSKTSGGAAKVECHVTTEGKVNTSGKGEVTAFTASECLSVKVCAGTITVLAVHLPWHTQLEEVEEKVRAIISSSGEGQPGYLLTCTISELLVEDECTGETTAAAENTSTDTKVVFDSKSAHLKCSVGGVEAGVITGTESMEAAGAVLNVGGPVIILAGATAVTSGATVLVPSTIRLTFENMSPAQQIWLNGAQDIPGVFTINNGNNFSITAVGGKACGLALLPFPGTCQVNINSAAAGVTGAYEVEYGLRVSVLLLLEGK